MGVSANDDRSPLGVRSWSSHLPFASFERNPWPWAAEELGLDADALTTRAADLASVVGDAFSDAAAAPEVAALDPPLPGRLVDLVAARAMRCRTVLGEG